MIIMKTIEIKEYEITTDQKKWVEMTANMQNYITTPDTKILYIMIGEGGGMQSQTNQHLNALLPTQ